MPGGARISRHDGSVIMEGVHVSAGSGICKTPVKTNEHTKFKEGKMATTQPIRNKEQVEELKEYYRKDISMEGRKGQIALRNYILLVIGFNTALRIGDILNLTWDDVYSNGAVKAHITVREQKTGKENVILLNEQANDALLLYYSRMAEGRNEDSNPYLFPSPRNNSKPISRSQAYRIVRVAAEKCGMENVSCHSMRKTFGYQAWKKGVSLTLLTCVFNHSSQEITKRYLGIAQDEKDQVYAQVLI